MLELWTTYGFYLWALTTALVVIALAWLAWSTFTASGADEGSAEREALTALAERVDRLTDVDEALPHMQATLGRALQMCGLARYTDPTGSQAFSLALANARGDGFVLSSSVRGGLTAKPLAGWASSQALTAGEQAALDDARAQPERA
jgi:hypothetical protein